jgi:hypothetical protein
MIGVRQNESFHQGIKTGLLAKILEQGCRFAAALCRACAADDNNRKAQPALSAPEPAGTRSPQEGTPSNRKFRF